MLSQNSAFIWNQSNLLPINIKSSLDELISIDEQIELVEKNIVSFLEDGLFLNMLLWGERGSGKSSLIKKMLIKYHEKGLRVIQFIDDDFKSIYNLYKIVEDSPYKVILLFDDISFNNDDERYRSFKSLLEGGLMGQPPNLMFVATSNRRHLVFEKALDTNDIYDRDNENETISLYSRFGLVVGFYPMGKEDYIKIVEYYLNIFKIGLYDGWVIDAENFAMNRGGRNGRVAKQFAIFKKIYG
jgi:predicted AAA+ superfamily ATPase